MGVGKPSSLPVATPTLPLPVPGLPVATTTQSGDRVQSVGVPSETADWRVNTEGGDYVVDLPAAGGYVLALDADGNVVMRGHGPARAVGVREPPRLPVDGVAHDGLDPDWVEDLRRLAGQEIVDDLGRGAEAYRQMWERADGIPTGCRPASAKLTRRGFAGARLGASTASLLRRAGQPRRRGAKAWRYCLARGKLVAALTPAGRVALVGSTAPGHKARGIRTGMKAKRPRKGTKAFGRGVRKRGRHVYAVRGGRVRAVAVTTATSRKAIRRYLMAADLR